MPFYRTFAERERETEHRAYVRRLRRLEEACVFAIKNTQMAIRRGNADLAYRMARDMFRFLRDLEALKTAR